jgi:beta-galactosidase
VAAVDPTTQFGHLRYPRFVANLEKEVFPWGDLRIEGYIQGKQVIAKTMSGRGVDQENSHGP